jgi:putative Mg2+ transporter-C (MgtC) family protein
MGLLMPTQLQWSDVALRLLLAVIAGLLIGYNRSEHGKAAGMRTTLLVCLAAVRLRWE